MPAVPASLYASSGNGANPGIAGTLIRLIGTSYAANFPAFYIDVDYYVTMR